MPPMSAPLCLVHNQDCRLSLNPAALAFLCSVTQPVVVVTIVGPFRTGKSFLMKRLVQKCTGKLKGEVFPPSGRIWGGFLMALCPQAPCWAMQCRHKRRASGCGVCPTRANLVWHWCCWTPRGWETPTRWVPGVSSPRPPQSPLDPPKPNIVCRATIAMMPGSSHWRCCSPAPWCTTAWAPSTSRGWISCGMGMSGRVVTQ